LDNLTLGVAKAMPLSRGRRDGSVYWSAGFRRGVRMPIGVVPLHEDREHRSLSGRWCRGRSCTLWRYGGV